MYLSTPLTRKGSHAEMDENSVSSQIFLILLSYISCLILNLAQKAKFNFCIQAMSKQYSGVWLFGFFFGGGGRGEHAQKAKFGDKALRSVLFLASFISF